MSDKPDSKSDSNSANTEQRRVPSRFSLRAHATLVSGDGNWAAHLVNLSAEGALIAIPGDHDIVEHNEVTVAIELSDDDCLIMHGTVMHVKEHYVGLRCKAHGEQDEDKLSELIQRFEQGEAISVDY